MLAQGIPTTVLEPQRGNSRDRPRLWLLRVRTATPPAGTAAHRRAEHARVLVVAVDDPEQSLKIVTLARKHFPQLQVVARARYLTHWNADATWRDTGAARAVRVQPRSAAPCWS